VDFASVTIYREDQPLSTAVPAERWPSSSTTCAAELGVGAQGAVQLTG